MALSMIACMGCSAFYHQFACCSKRHYDKYLNLDYLGIGVMMFGMTFTSLYVGWYS
jgi:predicted membrane channel-forming protein YqfA (hemolysin III family)